MDGATGPKWQEYSITAKTTKSIPALFCSTMKTNTPHGLHTGDKVCYLQFPRLVCEKLFTCCQLTVAIGYDTIRY